MTRIDFDHTDYKKMLSYFAKQLKSKVVDSKLQLPSQVGDGFMKLVQMPNGLQGLISDYTVQSDFILNRTKSAEDYFTLRFDEVVSIAGETSGEPSGTAGANHVRSAVYLGNTRFDWMFLTTGGTHIRSVNVLFSRQWLNDFVGVETIGEDIKKFLSLKMSAFNYEPMDLEYKRLLNEVLGINADSAFDSFVIQNRIMLLVERFFTRIYHKMNDLHFEVSVSSDDISNLRIVEKELLKDFTAEPPGIDKLARLAGMSSSKLKSSFREIFGLPVYQYFQKHRMNRAKAMLLSRKYNVREVGLEVGYSNLSNFAKAFRKSFDQLPSDLINRK